MDHDQRQHEILSAAIQVAETVGYYSLTKREVAKRADCSEALVQYHFNTVGALRHAVVCEANRTRNYTILVQLLHEHLVDQELIPGIINHIKNRSIWRWGS